MGWVLRSYVQVYLLDQEAFWAPIFDPHFLLRAGSLGKQKRECPQKEEEDDTRHLPGMWKSILGTNVASGEVLSWSWGWAEDSGSDPLTSRAEFPTGRTCPLPPYRLARGKTSCPL